LHGAREHPLEQRHGLAPGSSAHGSLLEVELKLVEHDRRKLAQLLASQPRQQMDVPQ
jgi:hypothetical protein